MARNPKGSFWNGEGTLRRMERAARVGVNVTMGEAVEFAKGHHGGWKNVSTTAEKSIQIATPARTIGDITAGLWGSLLVAYFKFLEFGTGRMMAFATLRTAAQRIYPRLPGNIRAAYRTGR